MEYAAYPKTPDVDMSPPSDGSALGTQIGYNSSSDDVTVVSSSSSVIDDEKGPCPAGPPAPYSIFSLRMRIWITIMATVGSFLSPLAGFIYFPAISSIAEDLKVPISLINLSLTTYIIFQGLFPIPIGEFGDMVGRRPALIISVLVFLLANIGMALQRSFAGLMVLRCLQSAGSAGTLALSYAIVADITPTTERGRYMSVVGVGVNLGMAIGPVIGGFLSQFLGWPSIFWTCTIFAALYLVLWVTMVPEMARNVVGNGSIPPQSWNTTLIEHLRRTKSGQKPKPGLNRALRFPRPMATFRIIVDKQTSQIFIIASVFFAVITLISATLSTLFTQKYHFSELNIGLCYLPYGLGCCLTIPFQGHILDRNYRRIARKRGFDDSHGRRDELGEFPIESARIQVMYPAMTIGAILVAGYGWALQAKVNAAVPLTLLFFIGTLVPTAFSVLGTLIIDLHPGATASATAAGNLVRCIFGAVTTSGVNSLIEAMGRGWFFTLLALSLLGCMPWLRFIETRGPKWRAEKLRRKSSQLQGHGI